MSARSPRSPSGAPASELDGVAPFSGLTRSEKIFTIVGSLLALLLAAIAQTAVAGPAVPSEEEGAPLGTFDPVWTKERISAQFADQRRLIEAAPTDDPRRAAIAAAEAPALATVDEFSAAMKRAFTTAIRRVTRPHLPSRCSGCCWRSSCRKCR